MSVQRRAMGNGVQSLFQGSGYRKEMQETVTEHDSIPTIPIDKIEANTNQPRKTFSENSLEELALSIKEHGLFQPIIIVKHPDKAGMYQIVAGERRFRAAKSIGLLEIPAIIRSFSPKEIAIIALLENIQREDLNIMEEANALLLLKKEFNVTQEEMAKELGRSRSTIANILRLLQLSKEVQDELALGRISQGHAIILLRVDGEEEQVNLCHQIIQKGYSVKETTLVVDSFLKPSKKAKKSTIKPSNPLEFAKETLSHYFEVPITCVGSQNKGKLILSFRNNSELNSILSKIKG